MAHLSTSFNSKRNVVARWKARSLFLANHVEVKVRGEDTSARRQPSDDQGLVNGVISISIPMPKPSGYTRRADSLVLAHAHATRLSLRQPHPSSSSTLRLQASCQPLTLSQPPGSNAIASASILSLVLMMSSASRPNIPPSADKIEISLWQGRCIR
jgi:hypothetical protein